MKRIGLCFFVVVILFLSMSVSALAETGQCGENMFWDLPDGVLTISGTGDMDVYK